MIYRFLLTLLVWSFCTTTVEAASVILNEIHPNPEGKDSGKEWIELKNTTNFTISLKNWSILINETPLSLSGDIKKFKIIETPLKNSNTEIKLLSPNKTIDKAYYLTTKEGQSLSRIEIFINNKSSQKWIWTSPSKKEPNLSLRLIKGKITEEIFENRFKINNQEVHIPPSLNLPLNSLLIKKNKPIEALIQRIGNNQVLYRYSLPSSYNFPPPKNNDPKETWFIVVLSITILFAPLLHKSYQQPEHE